MRAPLRIGNASGFYGDRRSAVREMLEGGPLDVLTGDYLAELTLLILGRDRGRDPARGYARTFLAQMEECLGLAADRRVAIVVNAGGLNPAGLAEALRELAGRLGVPASVAHVEGDDLLPRAAELGLGEPLTANAYLGAFGIAECLRAGATVVVTGRVTDASLVVGPGIAHFGWGRADLDALAGAVVAGHVLECGAQATGGNLSGFAEYPVERLVHPGFPLAELSADGSAVITKHPGTGGVVDVDTVTAQLLYEIGSPRYLGPDVVARFDTVRLDTDGPDRVRISGARGEPPPPTAKVCLNTLGGHRNEVTFVLTGARIDAKEAFVRAQLEAALPVRPAELVWSRFGSADPDAATEAGASVLLRCQALDPSPDVVGRAFSGAAVELALASYPGFHLTAPPATGSPYGVCTAASVPQDQVPHVAVLPDGRRIDVPPPDRTGPVRELLPTQSVSASQAEQRPTAGGPTRRVPLGTVARARSGDKGGTANIGVWARTEPAAAWLAALLTPDRVRELLPEAADLPVTVHPLPNLRAVNVVVDGLLGAGVAASTRFDPQAKAVGEWLLGRTVDVPEELVPTELARSDEGRAPAVAGPTSVSEESL
jgi:Acyclic terpene utilisation family protein AtuA